MPRVLNDPHENSILVALLYAEAFAASVSGLCRPLARQLLRINS